MKVNNPNTGHGKMTIRYNGNNVNMMLQPSKMRRIYMQRYKDVSADISENMVIETLLFDGTSILFSLSSHKVYYKSTDKNNEFWICSESSYADFGYINVDDEFIIFEGQITFVKEIIPDFIINEDYNIMLIFRKSNDWMDLLEKNNIDYELHSYSTPELQNEI